MSEITVFHNNKCFRSRAICYLVEGLKLPLTITDIQGNPNILKLTNYQETPFVTYGGLIIEDTRLILLFFDEYFFNFYSRSCPSEEYELLFDLWEELYTDLLPNLEAICFNKMQLDNWEMLDQLNKFIEKCSYQHPITSFPAAALVANFFSYRETENGKSMLNNNPEMEKWLQDTDLKLNELYADIVSADR